MSFYFRIEIFFVLALVLQEELVVFELDLGHHADLLIEGFLETHINVIEMERIEVREEIGPQPLQADLVQGERPGRRSGTREVEHPPRRSYGIW